MKLQARSVPVIAGSILPIFAVVLIAGAQPSRKNRQEPAPKIIRKSGGVLQESATVRVEPTYPPLAKAARVSGSVVVEVTLDEQGHVIAARSISGHPLLKDAAVSAARGWQFTPTLLSGMPVKVIGTITFRFHLEESPDDDPTGIRKLEKQVAASPDSPDLLLKLGQAYLSFVQEEKAVETFKRAIELKPDFAEAYSELGRTYFELQKDDEAIEAADAALRIAPNSKPAIYAHLMKGTILFRRDRFLEAIDSFKSSLAIHSGAADSDSDAAHIGLAYTYVKLGDKQSAMQEYQSLRPRDSLGPDVTKHLKQMIDAMP